MELKTTKGVGSSFEFPMPEYPIFASIHGMAFDTINIYHKGMPSSFNNNWHKWRNLAIIAFKSWDLNKDGTITLKEVATKATKTMSLEWLQNVDRCILYNGAVHADRYYKCLMQIEKMSCAHPISRVACSCQFYKIGQIKPQKSKYMAINAPKITMNLEERKENCIDILKQIKN